MKQYEVKVAVTFKRARHVGSAYQLPAIKLHQAARAGNIAVIALF